MIARPSRLKILVVQAIPINLIERVAGDSRVDSKSKSTAVENGLFNVMVPVPRSTVAVSPVTSSISKLEKVAVGPCQAE